MRAVCLRSHSKWEHSSTTHRKCDLEVKVRYTMIDSTPSCLCCICNEMCRLIHWSTLLFDAPELIRPISPCSVADILWRKSVGRGSALCNWFDRILHEKRFYLYPKSYIGELFDMMIYVTFIALMLLWLQMAATQSKYYPSPNFR